MALEPPTITVAVAVVQEDSNQLLVMVVELLVVQVAVVLVRMLDILIHLMFLFHLLQELLELQILVAVAVVETTLVLAVPAVQVW